MIERVRIYSFNEYELSGIFTGRSGPDDKAWPEDAVVQGFWVDPYLNPPSLKVKVSHDSFDAVQEGGRIPTFVCGMVDRQFRETAVAMVKEDDPLNAVPVVRRRY